MWDSLTMPRAQSYEKKSLYNSTLLFRLNTFDPQPKRVIGAMTSFMLVPIHAYKGSEENNMLTTSSSLNKKNPLAQTANFYR